jgi:hypothetical protein
VQRGKEKECVTEVDDSSASAPLPNAPSALAPEPRSHVQVDDSHADGSTTDPETYAVVERDDGEGEGEGDDEDRTELEPPELEPGHDEVEGQEVEDEDEVDEDVDMNTDPDTWEVRDLMDDDDDIERYITSNRIDTSEDTIGSEVRKSWNQPTRKPNHHVCRLVFPLRYYRLP